jgi:adenosylcobinamide-GDP ribazoletransferase
MSKKEFGGVTGDLSGFFLCICECAAVVCGALAQAVGGILL